MDSDSPSIQPRGWYSRGYLPHFDGGQQWQFLTLHQADAVPERVLDRWKFELKIESEETRKAMLRRRVERYLDQGYGNCDLLKPHIAEAAQEALLHRDGNQFRLHSWVIMPNHIHFLIKPCEGIELEDILQSYKSFTAHKINRRLRRSGQFWQYDYYDRYMRDGRHFSAVVRYIERNPVKARLCQEPNEWRYSSAYFRSKEIDRLL